MTFPRIFLTLYLEDSFGRVYAIFFFLSLAHFLVFDREVLLRGPSKPAIQRSRLLRKFREKSA